MAERPTGPPNPWGMRGRPSAPQGAGRAMPPGSSPAGNVEGLGMQAATRPTSSAGRSMPPFSLSAQQQSDLGGGRARPIFGASGPVPRQMVAGVGSGVPLRPSSATGPNPAAMMMGMPAEVGITAGRAAVGPPTTHYQQQQQMMHHGRGQGLLSGQAAMESKMSSLAVSDVAQVQFESGDSPPGGATAASSGASKVSASSAVSEASSVGTIGLGRGATRGSKVGLRTSVLVTKPANTLSKKGEGGEPVKLITNHLRLLRKPNWALSQYRVDFDPDLDADRTVVRKALVREHSEKLGEYLFDGTILHSVHNYCPNDTPMELVSKRKEDDSVVRITVRRVGEVSPMDYSFLQVLNIINRRCMEKMGLKQIGRDFFDVDGAVTLRDFKLEIIPGIRTSIRQFESEILMCCEVSNKILRTDTLLDQFRMVMRQGGTRESVGKLVGGSVVITRYNERTYRVDDIAWDLSAMSTFKWKDGTDISYADYYKKRYGLIVRDLKQPLVLSMPKMADRRRGDDTPIHLVPEFCHMTGLSDEQRSNFRLMKAVGDYTRLGPKDRIDNLMKYVTKLSSGPVEQFTKTWNVKFANNLETLAARIREPEQIFQKGGRGQRYTKENADWGTMMRNFQLFNPGTGCARWIIIPCASDEKAGIEFGEAVKRAGAGMGFIMANPKVLRCPGVGIGEYRDKCTEAASLQGCQMIMVIVPNNKGDVYQTVKTIFCINNPVPSQVITLTLLQKAKGIMSVASKVVVQMAAKIGAEPWAVNIPCPDTMVVGYDSYHDSTRTGYSAGAVVSTLNNTCTRFFSTSNLHKNGEELLAYMKSAIGSAVKKYAEFNGGKLPKRVIVYRDGVGEGQIHHVKEHEVEAIKEVFKNLGFEPMFGYIVVSKRINARFFTAGQMPNNPYSGTIVDDVVTLPERQDFYLISQSVRQGTVNPTSYNVLEDSTGLKPGQIQVLTYKLTHLYFNWTGTVRVPAVCQYAHKLAFLIGTSIHQSPHVSLGNTLFYL